MTHEELDEMAHWTQAWKNQESSPPVRLDTRMWAARRLARWGRWVYGLAAVAMTLIGAMFVVMNPKPVIITLMVVCAAVMWVSAVTFWWSTRIREEAAPDTALSFLKAHRKLLRVRLKTAERGTWGVAMTAGFVAAWFPWMISEHIEAYTQEPMRAVIGVVGALMILIFALVMSRRERRKTLRELEELESLEASIRAEV